ncbi:hypothetical protein diail_7127 [Diaporthe ilicicola]|nr:hypothetical protein diail_7127 [Diaporthe ilicicola]
MPKSKRTKVYHLTQVNKKTREQKERLFQDIRDTVPKYEHCFVLSFDNMRNNHLKDVRHELSDSRLFFGKTKLMARALGTSPEDAAADGIHRLSPHLSGSVALLFTSRPVPEITAYFGSFAPVDFARAGAVAPRGFVLPPGVLYATGGAVPPEHDVPLGHTIEPELRRLGVPTRMVRGKVVLGEEGGEGEGYTVCKEGQVLDSRQTRLLKLFDQCLSEFKVQILAYWESKSGIVTEVEEADENAMDGVDEDDE